MFSIELDVFSGRPNPRWQLSFKEEQEFMEQLIATPSLIKPVARVASKLGYRGLIVEASDTTAERLRKVGLPTYFRVAGNSASPAWLIDTPPLEIGADVYDHVQEEMKATADDQTNEPAESITASAIEGWGMSCSNNYLTSSTNFDFWNANPTHMANNNCYNYAANWRNNTFAVPGRQSGQYFSSVSCSDVSNSVRGDGWSDSCVSSNNLSIYLVIWPGYDFHFYRLCYNGRWCHKPGDDPATNKDNNGNFITNPETCAKSPYSNCSYGYFYASNGIVVS